MKIKHITLGGVEFWGYLYSIARAFERHGITSRVITYSDYKNGWHSFPKKIFDSDILINLYHDKFLKEILQAGRRSDCVILLRSDLLKAEDIQRIRKECQIPVVIWLIDSVYTIKDGLNLCGQADRILCYNQEDQNMFVKNGQRAHFTPLAFDKDMYKPLGKIQKDIDLYYVGNMHADRRIFLNELLHRLSADQLNIYIAGQFHAWYLWYRTFWLKKQFPYLMRHVTNKRSHHQEINIMYNRARICLNVLPQQATSALNIKAYEICGSGGFQLINRNDILQETFREGEDIVAYSDMEELVSLIRYYVDPHNEPERAEIAQRGYDTAIKNHSFDKRIAEVIPFITDM